MTACAAVREREGEVRRETSSDVKGQHLEGRKLSLSFLVWKIHMMRAAVVALS